MYAGITIYRCMLTPTREQEKKKLVNMMQECQITCKKIITEQSIEELTENCERQEYDKFPPIKKSWWTWITTLNWRTEIFSKHSWDQNQLP